ncbi:MAG: ATP--guanido phosphotransferase [Oscillospiraceae bacterium]|nr:ATP--guanido phosphotransferase [Oscillospiraceae bacterium]
MINNSIVSYRVRLARNIKGHPFPGRMNAQEREEMSRSVAQTLTQAASGAAFTYLPPEKLEGVKAQALKERRLVSPEFAETPRGLILSADESVSVMLCEEDHLRIQTFSNGGNLSECLQKAQDVETLIDEKHPFAFDETLGFLTACPTNLGTGLRASALMHLPALTDTTSMRRLIQQAGASGLAVRGFYGEGTQAAWGYYQISNAVTLGLGEQEIITALAEVTSQIAEFELKARQTLYQNDPVGLTDRVWRASGILQNARRISTQEAMECLAAVRLGVSLDLLPGIDTELADRLSQESWPGLLHQAKGPFSSQMERDEIRATMLRQALTKGEEKVE